MIFAGSRLLLTTLSLLEMRQSPIGQIFFHVTSNNPRSFDSMQFPFRFLSDKCPGRSCSSCLEAKSQLVCYPKPENNGKQMNYHCLKEWIRNDLMNSCYITGPGTSKSFLNNFASPHHFSTNILVSWCLPLSHIFTQNFLRFPHPPLTPGVI